MQEKYFKVPDNIITGKDLDYLSDMFQWNYGCLKSNSNAIDSVNDTEIKEILQKGVDLFNRNLNSVLEILSGFGGNTNE